MDTVLLDTLRSRGRHRGGGQRLEGGASAPPEAVRRSHPGGASGRRRQCRRRLAGPRHSAMCPKPAARPPPRALPTRGARTAHVGSGSYAAPTPRPPPPTISRSLRAVACTGTPDRGPAPVSPAAGGPAGPPLVHCAAPMPAAPSPPPPQLRHPAASCRAGADEDGRRRGSPVLPRPGPAPSAGPAPAVVS